MPAERKVVRWSSTLLQEIWDENRATRAGLCREVEGLSEAQLCFQPAARAWSIGEILDHLCRAERSVARAASRILQQAAGLGRIGEPGSMDFPPRQIDLEAYQRPATAPESALPVPGLPLARLLADLEEGRERLEEVTARADGRVVGNVTLPHFQLGELDFYQWLAVEGAHEAKHLDQIRRIKSHIGFPQG